MGDDGAFGGDEIGVGEGQASEGAGAGGAEGGAEGEGVVGALGEEGAGDVSA